MLGKSEVKMEHQKSLKIKMLITKICTTIQSALADDTSSLTKLEDLYNQFQKKLEEFDEAFAQVQCVTSEEELEGEVNRQLDFRQEKMAITYSLLEKIEAMKAAKAASLPSGASKNPPELDALSESSRHGPQKPRLPKIDIDPYWGDLDAWELFIECFEELVDKRDDLTETEKFIHLKTLLRGEALQTLKGFSSTSKNYEEAIKLLKETYGQPERLRLRHVSQLIHLARPTASKGQSLVSSLTSMLNQIRGHIRSLENLGPLTAEMFLCPWIVSKFPETVTLEWSRKSKGKESDLQYTLDFIKSEIYRLDFSSEVRLLESQESKATAPATAAPKGTALSLTTQVGSSEATPTGASAGIKCAACHRHGHSIRECKKFKGLSVQVRSDVVKKAKLCWRCLRNKFPCKCNNLCPTCGYKHHALMCKQAGKPAPAAAGGLQLQAVGTHGQMNAYSAMQGSEQHGSQHGPQYRPLYGPQLSGLQQGLGPYQPQGPLQQQQQPFQQQQRAAGDPTAGSRGGPFQQSNVNVTAATPTKWVTLLPIAKAQVRSPSGQLFQVNVLLDSGADSSYIQNQLARTAGLREVSKSNVAYSAFGGEREHKPKLRSVYEIDMIDINGEPFSLRAVGVDTICQPIKRAAVSSEALKAFKHLSPMASDYEETQVSTVHFLVGLDQFWSLINEHYTVRHHNLVAQATRFGYVISGSYSTPEGAGIVADTHRTYTTHTQLLVCDLSDRRAEDIWALDTVGIHPQETKVSCLEQDPIYKELISKLEYDHQIQRYTAPILWKSEAHKLRLPNNFKQAAARLNHLHNKTLDQDPDLCSEYYAIFNDYLAAGQASIVPPDQIIVKGRPTYYMPHMPIIKPQASSSRIRPVFDASSKSTGISLNDLCHSGPSLLPDLVGVLIRWRRWKYVISGDVKQAFLNILIKEQDRDAHRFLLKVGNSIVHCRFNVLPFGNTCSPFVLQAVLRYHFKTFPDSEARKELTQNLYMDNVLSGSDTQEGAEELYSNFCAILQRAGMDLDKWSTNSGNLESRLLLDNRKDNSQKILGVEWNKQDDSFEFKGRFLSEVKLPLTKRSLLSILGSFFDPLGLISPYILKGKIIFQNLWKINTSWDSPLPENIAIEIGSWLKSSKGLINFSVSRAYFQHQAWNSIKEEIQVIAFGDASESALGAVVYLRWKGEDAYQVSLVASRSRVAPLNKLTLPRLELTASLLAARLARTVCDELELDYRKVSYYTDSEIVLHWVNSRAYQFQTFICNRLAEIQRLSTPAQWYHCSGLQNPADMASRGLSGYELVENDMWLNGPSWLKRYDYYPDNNTLPNLPMNAELEIKKNILITTQPISVDVSFDFKRVGKFTKVVNSLAYILRVAKYCKLPRSQWLTGPLSAEEVAAATTHLWRLQQKIAFQTELTCLKQGKQIPKGSALSRLNPFICDSGLIRVGGRLRNASLPFEERFPCILPKGHVSNLFIRHIHTKNCHAGVDTLVALVSKTFHIMSVRPIAKKITRFCVTCQRMDKRTCNQVSPPLPSIRVNPARPFEHIGIDFAGPLYCKGSPKKHYILIGVCSVTRSIHLELTNSMSIHELKLAFRRLCARRGIPSSVISDNATTFASAAKQMNQWFGPLAPRWSHIAPRAPWWGGLYERHIKTVKSALKKSIGRSRLKPKELEAIILEVENLLNERPLVGGQDGNILTPNHFLRPHFTGESPNPPGDIKSFYINGISALKNFWAIWSNSYLKSLPKVVPGHKERFPLKLNDVVLMDNEKLSGNRLSWPLGRIAEIIDSADGKVRLVRVQTADSTFLRPVQRLIHLEMSKSPLE